MSDAKRPRSPKEILTRINNLLATDAVSGEVRWLLETQRELAENLASSQNLFESLRNVFDAIGAHGAKLDRQEQQIQELLSWRATSQTDTAPASVTADVDLPGAIPGAEA